MRRLLIWASVISAVLALWATAAYAGQANPHFIGTPTCTKNADFSLSCSGKAAGLDELPTSAFLTADKVTQTVRCVNPAGNIAPGQGTSETNVIGPTQNITPHNGQITFKVSLPAPAVPTPAQAGCPAGTRSKWSVQVLSVTYVNVVLHIQQDGTDVLTFPFGTIDP
jgi:hypothetical protein